MKPIFAAILTAGALSTGALCAAGAPALAQPFGPPPGPAVPGHDLREQIDGLQHRIDDGVRAGQLDHAEFDRASRTLNDIRGDEMRMRMNHDGRLSDMDRAVLQHRIDELSRSIHWMREHGPMVPAPGAPVPPPPRPMPMPGAPLGGAWSLDQREDWIQHSIDRGRDDGSLNRREAFRAQRALDDIRRMQAHLVARDHGNLTGADRLYLEQRLDRLRGGLHWMRENSEAAPWARP